MRLIRLCVLKRLLLELTERQVIVIYYSLTYRNWSDDRQVETGVLEQVSVTRDELFMRKLVDATLMKNKLWAHLSNECEDRREHAVYLTEYNNQKPAEHGTAIADAALSMCKMSSMYSAEYMLWNGSAFQELDLAESSSYTMELAEQLLDHYMVRGGITYEFVYSVLDADRNKVLFFMKEVDL
ncbi:hypothetical protein QP794_09605 [Paenibacillus sp. UMB7766-LJ446]|uniref:hypothetical protein n=1 Tax=Paenibacillus sp. UMB7766-LJ446 TaxID=3046313 RepID=UPI00254A0577|nr:hypothetical protein [Paenibacillus sp. UMB7766-LJ446]MDK8190342.1 hypothetical protein [Paenibacillus sp. UMB7766-LJ446]